MSTENKGLQWRRLDDRMIGFCILLVQTEIMKSNPEVLNEMNELGFTNVPEAQGAFTAWARHMMDRMDKEYVKRGWEYDDQPHELKVYHRNISPTTKYRQELKDSIEYHKNQNERIT